MNQRLITDSQFFKHLLYLGPAYVKKLFLAASLRLAFFVDSKAKQKLCNGFINSTRLDGRS